MRRTASLPPIIVRPTQKWFRKMKAVAESVHILPVYPLEFRASVAWRDYEAKYTSATTDRIYLSRYSQTPTLSFLHELGHFVDRRGLAPSDSKNYGTADFRGEGFRSLFLAIVQSNTIQELVAAKRRATPRLSAHISYLMRPQELWARAYSQYIAVKTQNPDALRELRGIQAAIQSNRRVETHWRDEELLPIMEAVETLLRSKGWMP